MADNTDIRGIWTYRSFANTPGILGDFSKLKVWEAELSLEAASRGGVVCRSVLNDVEEAK
jgi:hypothetical protein